MSATKSQPVSPAGGGAKGRLTSYWQSLVYEWRKISWPEKKQWIDSTIVVFVFVLIMMVALVGLDAVVGFIMSRLFNFGG